MAQITPAQLQALLTYASKRLGMTPEQLAATVQSGKLSTLSQDPRVQQIADNPKRLTELANSPEVQAFLAKLTGGKTIDG